jgi:hypothetical protein
MAEPETYWSISVGPKTITLGYGVEPGSEQAAIRLVCSPRDSFIALNMSRGANAQMIERIKRIAGSEIPVTLQIERARFTARGPVVEADDPALPITVVLRSSLDDPVLAAIRQGKRLRVSWQPGGQQGGFETPLENFAELEEEWQGRCARLATTDSPISSEAAPPPVRSAPDVAPAAPAPAIVAPSFSLPSPSLAAPSVSAPAAPEVFRPGDNEIQRPPANVPSRLPPQEPPVIIDR